MRSSLHLVLTDKFIWLLVFMLLMAIILPVRGSLVQGAQMISSAAIFTLFLFHGLRLQRAEVIAGIRNWRLQGTIFLFVFGITLVIGLVLSLVLEGVVPADLALGFLFVGVLPTTVQSATAYCSIARGNVAASVVASAWINLVGVVAAPVLFAILASASGDGISSGAFGRIFFILILPFMLGQALQPWLRARVIKHKGLTGWMDKTAIGIAVYVAFSGAVVGGIGNQLDSSNILLLPAALGVYLALAFGGAWMAGRALKFPVPDRITLLFSGAQKSLAIGVPLAAALFTTERAGMIILPLLFYHLMQFMVSAPLAIRFAQRSGD